MSEPPAAQRPAPPLVPPSGWGIDGLSRFIENARQNTFATFQNLPQQYARIRDIDAAFHSLGTNLDNPPDQVVPFFVYQSHSAYLASARLVLSGQLGPLYMTLRGCLEHALYGHYINRNPTSFEIWRNRGESEDARRLVRATFTMGTLVTSLRASDRGLAEIAQSLYDRSIDFGAHPNEHALFSALTVSETDAEYHFDVAYLHGVGAPLNAGLKTSAQVGVTALRIFELVFGDRMRILGLSDQIRTLSEGL